MRKARARGRETECKLRRCPGGYTGTTGKSMVWVDPSLCAHQTLSIMATKGMRHLPIRKAPTWLFRAALRLWGVPGRRSVWSWSEVD